ncbi:hypothetical protein BG011_000651 [Mortierella polycephala]|uniref:Uncharacterized protein n=1 Tax=Mortierella polycephala TaxID=41804 RepID=A0A9P6Q6M5_9FUNG|nr:hypothetical protein BG011_000651 [Mortierella polycephala]
MKLSLFHCFAIIACVLAVLSVHAEANNNSRKNKYKCVADPDLQFFCDESEVLLDEMIEDMLALVPQDRPKKQHAVQPLAGELGTTAARRRESQDLVSAENYLDFFTDVKTYFMNYWKNLKLIFSGRFSEGIFNQLKNSGSWCDNTSWYVKAIKAVINSYSGGALNVICDCVYPMIKKYNSFEELIADADADSLLKVLKQCPAISKEKIVEGVQKANHVHARNKANQLRARIPHDPRKQE